MTQAAAAPAVVRWRTGTTGCLFPFIIGGTALFAIAALRPALVAELARERRGAWIEWTSAVTVAGVNLPMLFLALWFAWETFRFGWRWADEIAITAGPDGLVPHRSLFMAPIAWTSVSDVRFVMLGRAPSILISLTDGRTRVVRGVDNPQGAAEEFVGLVRERLAMNTSQSGLE